MKKVVIIGGGASGMMAEHNEKPGKKILATGN